MSIKSIWKEFSTNKTFSIAINFAGTQFIGASKLAALAASQSALRSGAGLSKL